MSGKGSEFVVIENDIQRQLTENHLSSSLGVYKPVPPTRKHLGHTRVIANPTNMSYRRQIKSLTDRLQSKANTLWKKICSNRNLDKNVEVALLSSNTQLPTMYVLLKTHKFRVSEISSSEDVIDTCIVRPIVSCCNGPSEGVKKDETVCLKVPYISEFVSYEILRFVKRRGLKISVTFTPGRKLQDIFCKSRPLDGSKCTSNNCNICQMLEDNVNCYTSHPVYMITCNLCNEVYIGKSSRTLSHRLSEHLRYARNPNSTSYRDEALAVHYRDQHAGLQPLLSFKLLAVERSTITRKISEALYIQRFNPQLNDKEECVTLKRFLICS